MRTSRLLRGCGPRRFRPFRARLDPICVVVSIRSGSLTKVARRHLSCRYRMQIETVLSAAWVVAGVVRKQRVCLGYLVYHLFSPRRNARVWVIGICPILFRGGDLSGPGGGRMTAPHRILFLWLNFPQPPHLLDSFFSEQSFPAPFHSLSSQSDTLFAEILTNTCRLFLLHPPSDPLDSPPPSHVSSPCRPCLTESPPPLSLSLFL